MNSGFLQQMNLYIPDKTKVPAYYTFVDSGPFTDRLVRKFRLPVTGWRGR